MNRSQDAGPKPLRVLLISEFPRQGVIVGGVQSAVQVLVSALAELPGIEHVLVLSLNPECEKDEVLELTTKLTVHHACGQRRFTLPTRSLRNVHIAKKVAEKFRPDVVHGQGTGGEGDVATRLGLPSVITIHGVGTFEAELRERKHRFIGPARIWLTRRMVESVIRTADVLISISEFDRQYCSTFRTSPVVRIPNAVNPLFFQNIPGVDDSRHVHFGGLLIERKNITGLVRAFRKVKEAVPNAVLNLAGHWPDKAYFEEVQKNIHPGVRDAIIFHGNLRNVEMAALMGKAAVSVLFSVYENLPVVIAESLAMGKPVVSSRVGAVAEMIEDGVNGFLVKSRDEDALADRLVRVLQDRELRERMGLKGREIAEERWKPESVASRTLDAYRLACGVGQGSGKAVFIEPHIEKEHTHG